MAVYVTPPNFIWSDLEGNGVSKTGLIVKLNQIAQDIVYLNANLPPVPITIPLPVAQGGTGSTTAAGARTNLGLGTMAVQDASAVAITGGNINGTVIGATTQAAATVSLLTSKAQAAILAADVPGIVLAASFSATGKGHTIDWNINGNSTHPLRIAGMFNVDGTGMDMVFYTNTYTNDGIERMRIDRAGLVSINAGLTINTTASDGVILNANGSSGLIQSRSYGGSPTVSAGRAGGTLASPTKVLANDFLGFYRWDGHDGVGWSGNAAAQFYVQAPADWSNTSHPARIIFQTTPVGATSPNSALTLDSDQSALFSGTIVVVTGTATLQPLRFQSGTLMTTAAAGVLEYDGRAFYASSVSSSRQVVTTKQITTVTADWNGTNVNTAQPVFNTTEDVLTLAANTTYRFRAMYWITRAAGTTAHTTGVLFGGTATFTSIAYMATAINPTGTVLGTPQMIPASAASTLVVTASNSSATENLYILLEGIIRIANAGTIIPQFIYSVAPGGVPTIKANSFFEIWPVGIDTVKAVGNWS